MNKVKEGLTQTFKDIKPLYKKTERTERMHTSESDKNNEAPTDAERREEDNEEEHKDNEKKEHKNETKYIDDDSELNEKEQIEEQEEEQEEEDNEEKRILERYPEEKIAVYINETLKRVIKGENMLDDMKTFMDFVRIMPKNMFDENREYYATVLSNATINGVKLFDDINAAREFVDNVRNRRRSKKWLRPKAQKQIKQEIQKSLQISPMMLKNIKHRTNAINVYQY